jgi:hypothetical protein
MDVKTHHFSIKLVINNNLRSRKGEGFILVNNLKILDNSLPQFQLKRYLADLLTATKYSELSVATGYWDLPVMLELLPALESFLGTESHSEIRFLIGEEPKVRINQLDTSFPPLKNRSTKWSMPSTVLRRKRSRLWRGRNEHAS